MAKSPAVAADQPVQDAGAAPLTLNEFCARLSETDRRVELIGAFASVETRAGRKSGTAAQFAERYKAFINKPV